MDDGLNQERCCNTDPQNNDLEKFQPRDGEEKRIGY